jgi:hypothetical protein
MQIVGFQFDRVETPDGMVEKIDATAMDLKFGPLKGDVSGRNRGKNFLVRSVTGVGTVAAYIVGGQGTTGFNGPISESSLLRERLADNIGMAGQDQITRWQRTSLSWLLCQAALAFTSWWKKGVQINKPERQECVRLKPTVQALPEARSPASKNCGN